MRTGRGNQSTWRKPAPVPLCPPQIPYDLTWDRTRAAKVGSRRLTAWAMARPDRHESEHFSLCFCLVNIKTWVYCERMSILKCLNNKTLSFFLPKIMSKNRCFNSVPVTFHLMGYNPHGRIFQATNITISTTSYFCIQRVKIKNTVVPLHFCDSRFRIFYGLNREVRPTKNAKDGEDSSRCEHNTLLFGCTTLKVSLNFI
jgi:hypothetical protein